MGGAPTGRATPRLGVDAATWGRLEPLLDAALDLPAAGRAAWLDALPPAQADLRPLLQELLQTQGDLLQTAAVDAWLGDGTRQPGERVGPYRLLERLGEGGMGEVWRAERADGLMQREVALKLPFAWAGGLAARLGRERNILAALVHPNIARLYDAGIAEGGQPWLALELVAGQRIDHWADQHHLDVPARLRLALQAVRAVAHAHAQLVVHRDLKPSNLLVGADGQAKLLDFGIAKLLDAEPGADLTEQGAKLMTPGYASPEQMAGLPVGTRSDVYALGVLLYELLAGVSPYGAAGRSRPELEAAVLQAEPRRPSDAARDPARRKALRGDLDTIVLHAMARRPEDRYATADALADDIERHLTHRPLRARPDGRWQVLRKLLRRHRLAFGAGAAVALALVAGSGVALWQGLQARAERERAEQVKAFVVGILKDASPYHGRDVSRLTAADLVLQAEERLRRADIRSPRVRGELGVLLGESLLTTSRLEEAEQLLFRTRDDLRRELGDADALTLRARVAAAQTLRFRGKVAEHQRELAEVLPRVRQLEAAEPALLTETLTHVAMNAVDRGAYREAETLAVQAHETALRRLGADSPELASITVLRGLVHLYTQRFDSARAIAEEGWQRTRALHPEHMAHPRKMEALLVLGRALAETGEVQAGVAHLQDAVRLGEQMYAPDDLSLAMAFQNLARYQMDTGDGEGAAQAARRALASLVTQMPAEAAPAASTRATLGAALLLAGRPAEALAELEPAAATMAKAMPGHDMALQPAANAALASARLGRADEALARLQALAPALAASGVQPATRERARLARAAAERAAGRPADALATLQPLLAATTGPPRVLRDRMRGFAEAGWAQLALGRREEARAAFDAALAESARLETTDSALRRDARAGQVAAALP